MNIGLSDHFTYKKLIRFTLPSIIMMIFTSIYGVVDGLFVSNCVGDKAFASINLIMPFLMILGAFGFMIGTGGSAIVSKTLGEGEKEKANKYFSMLIYLIILAGFILTILGITFIKPIAKFFGAEGEVLTGCIKYGVTTLIFLIPFMLQNAFQSFLIVAEKPTFGLVISIIAGVTNIVGDFLFVYVFKWGLIGAAAATGLGQFLGGFVPFIYFMSKKNKSSLKLVKSKFDFKVILKACTNGSSEMLSNISMSIVNILFNMKLMELIGSDGVVAYGIIMYISFVFVGTYIGYSIGTAPIIGYNYGAENKDELKSLLKRSVILIGSVSIILTILAEIFAKGLAKIFVSYDKELLELTTNAIRIYSISFLVSGFGIFSSSFFTALNNGAISAIISFLRTLVFQTSMIFLLSHFFGITGLWFAITIADVLALIISIVFLITNRKKYGYM